MSSEEWGCPSKLGFCDCAPFVGDTGRRLHDGLKLYFFVFPEIRLFSSSHTLKVKANISPNNVYLKWLPCGFIWWPITDLNCIFITHKTGRTISESRCQRQAKRELPATRSLWSVTRNSAAFYKMNQMLQVYKLFQKDPRSIYGKHRTSQGNSIKAFLGKCGHLLT